MIRLPKFTYLHRQLLVKTTPYKTKLKTAEIDTVIEHYSLEQCHVAGYLEGSSSDNFLLKTDQGNKVLKKYFWSLPSIMQEHSLLRYLNNLGFPTPNLEYSKGLKSTIELNGRCYSIYNFVEGYNILHYYITTKMRRLLVHQAGTILAQLHQVTKNFIPNGYKYNGFKTDGIML
jgi:Ser/Thr protein kinase RdoA (MazF antagonist)